MSNASLDSDTSGKHESSMRSTAIASGALIGGRNRSGVVHCTADTLIGHSVVSYTVRNLHGVPATGRESSCDPRGIRTPVITLPWSGSSSNSTNVIDGIGRM